MNKHTVVEHHTHYVELHGFDRSEFIPRHVHEKIDHRKIFPGISVHELSKISMAAHERTPKRKQRKRVYNKEYQKRMQRMFFTETPTPHVLFHEQLTYDPLIGNVYYSAWFAGNRAYLPVIEIDNDHRLEEAYHMNIGKMIELEAQARAAICAPETKEEIQDVESEFYPDTVKEEGA